MTITLTTPLIIMIVADLLLFIWAVTRDNAERLLGSDRCWAIMFWIVLNLIAWPIYGGIYWW